MTLVQYSAIEPPHFISFARNVKVRIFSKEAGSNPDVWGVEIQGRRGYVNKIHIKEEQTIVSSTKLIRVPTELLNNQGSEKPAADAATASSLTKENDQATLPVVNDVKPKIQAGDDASSSIPAEVSSSSNPEVKLAQLAEDASKNTLSTPSAALNSNSEANTLADIPVKEPLVIKKEAYVTTTENAMLTRQDNVNDTEEVQLEVIAPFVNNSQANQVAQSVPPTAELSKIPSDATPQISIDSKDPSPNTSTVNEPSTIKKTSPSSNVVPNTVTASPSKPTETANLTTAAPVLPSTTQPVVPAKIAPQAAVTTTNPSVPVITADTAVPFTTTSPPVETTRPADNPAVTTTSIPKTEDSSIIKKGTPSTDPIIEPLPLIVNKTDPENSSEDSTTNLPSPVASKMLQIDDSVTEAKILLQDDDLNTTDTSSEDWNSMLDDSAEDYENTTDSREALDSSETTASADEDTIITPPPFIDPYESLKNQDIGYQGTDVPVSDKVETPSPPKHHHYEHSHHNHDHKYLAGGQVPLYPTLKPHVPSYPSPGNSAQIPFEESQSASAASSEEVNESIQVPNKVEIPISVDPIQSVPFESINSDSETVPDGVGSVEQVLPPFLEVPPAADLTIEDNVITETETIDDGPSIFLNLWSSITGLFANSVAPDDSQLQQDAIDSQQKMNDMLFTTPEEAAAAKPAILGELTICMLFDNGNKVY